MNDKQFRRCLNCGTKSHRHYWHEEKCPVCEIASPYIESKHGGLPEGELRAANTALNYMIEKIEGEIGGTPCKER